MSNILVYSSGYDFGLWGMDLLHPFDGKKFSRAWGLLQSSIPNLDQHVITPDAPIRNDVLQLTHTLEYLNSLKTSAAIAAVIEVGMAKLIPSKILINNLLNPIRLATEGTVLAAEYAVKNCAIAMNLGGGFHHAFANHGEGFCFFADASLAIKTLRRDGLLSADDTIAMIDLDAHRGNGFESFFIQDASVSIFDMYNFQVYPGLHKGDMDDYPFLVPLRTGMLGDEYLKALEDELPGFLAALKNPKLIFYNAGTDVLKGDPLGGLNVEFNHVIQRDIYVLDQLRHLNVPIVVMTSGGYTSESYKLIAACAKHIMQNI